MEFCTSRLAKIAYPKVNTDNSQRKFTLKEKHHILNSLRGPGPLLPSHGGNGTATIKLTHNFYCNPQHFFATVHSVFYLFNDLSRVIFSTFRGTSGHLRTPDQLRKCYEVP